MKINKLITFAAALTVTGHLMAEEVVHVWEDPRGWWGNHFVYAPSKFTANEFSIDAFGSYGAGERRAEDLFKTNIRHGTWGGGVGVNYFLTREIGIGGDINIPDNGGNFIDNASGSLILRLPIERAGLAPYVFGGGGRLTDRTWEWEGHAGVGIEVRLNPITGLFADARYIWPDKASDSILIRSGVRFVF